MPRMSTGLRRAHPFQMAFDDDEDEFSKRLSISTRISRAELFRKAFFKNGWRLELENLRKNQTKLSRKLKGEIGRDAVRH